MDSVRAGMLNPLKIGLSDRRIETRQQSIHGRGGSESCFVKLVKGLLLEEKD